MFTGTTDNPKIILELGAGTALPSILLAKATAPGLTALITTDRPNAPHILDNIQRAYQENHISWSMDQPQQEQHRIMVRSLGWGDFTLASPHNPAGGLLQLLKDVSPIVQVKGGSSSPGKIDLILGSDTFYNPPGTLFLDSRWTFATALSIYHLFAKPIDTYILLFSCVLDFEPLLATVSFIINRHNPDCVFLTTYQNRSAKRNIDHLLEKWGLEGRVIDWEAFDFDMSKFVSGGDAKVDSDISIEEKEGQESEDEEDRWLRLAKEEIGRAMSTPEAGSTKKPGLLALVDYSSGSDSDEDESAVDPVGESEDEEDDTHKMGDGGSLSSVHFLWICKHGRGDDAFAAWVKSRCQADSQ